MKGAQEGPKKQSYVHESTMRAIEQNSSRDAQSVGSFGFGKKTFFWVVCDSHRLSSVGVYGLPKVIFLAQKPFSATEY